MVVDPVCRMPVDEQKSRWRSQQGEKAYYFCSPGCKRIFEVKPERYVK